MNRAHGDKQAVIAIVKGGLGNQLFIYAAARALALRTGRALYLDDRLGYLRDSYRRSYRLERFPIRAERLPEAWRLAPTLKHPRHKLVRALNKVLPRNQRSYHAERHHEDTSQLTGLVPWRKRITLFGYWQDEAYFADQAEAIRRELAPPEPTDTQNRELGGKFAAADTVSLHVRRVDYPMRLAEDYYQAAIQAAHAAIKSPRFVIFGDDLKWPQARLDFGVAAVEVVAHNAADEIADLWLMTCCRHAITANSSFSWWGAWLGASTKAGLVWTPTNPGFQLRPARGWRQLSNRLEIAQ